VTSDRGPVLDISPLLSPRLAVFPGDTPLERHVVLDVRRGDPVTLSTLRATCHLGAHVDAPSHYDPEGVGIDERSLEPFIGTCRVVGVRPGRGGTVTADMARAALRCDPSGAPAGHPGAPRVLLATLTYPDPTAFRSDFAHLAPGLIEWLAECGVTLVGVDTPSIDAADSKDLPAHRAACRHDMNILEGLVLDGVSPGMYELVALPLRLAGFDGSPVRAVLRPAGP